MKHWLATFLAATTLLLTSAALAAFHLYTIEQVYSNADGTIQFVVLTTSFNGENLWSFGGKLSSTDSGGTRSISFTHDLPSASTAGTRVLIATQGFADLGIVAPDYIIPNHFIATGPGSLTYVNSTLNYPGGLPADGVSALSISGMQVPNVATNFAGESASVQPTAAVVNYEGLWWAAPAGSENGWGINFAQQGNVIFGTWFTYDTTGKGWWLTLITNANPSPGVFTADLFAVTDGSPFNATPFHGGSVAHVGTATLTFSDVSNGTFHYDVTLPGGTVSQTKAVTQQQLAAPPLATCSSGKTLADLAAATNYQDIWWAGTSATPGTEQGWGINFTHQGDLVFASWFTFDLEGKPLWLVATAAKISPGVYKGDLFRPSGPRFDAYDKSQWNANASVGTLTLTFADGNNAAFDYTVMIAPLPGPVTQHKTITRQLFSALGTTCQ